MTLAFALRREITPREAAHYLLVQLLGGVIGEIAANAMFELPLIEFSTKLRTGPGQWLGEFIITFGLLLTILGTVRHRPAAVPSRVALYVTAAYWFTSSTSFANPTITITRSLSDSFAGIAPAFVLGFIAAQLADAGVALIVAKCLSAEERGQ